MVECCESIDRSAEEYKLRGEAMKARKGGEMLGWLSWWT